MKKKTYPKGDELMVAVMNQIIAHPESWKQSTWHCGTSHCFFGHAQILGGRPQSDDAFDDGKELMGLSYADASWLSNGNRKLTEIYGFVKNYIVRDRDGYNRAGYNRDGYDRDGYNRDGYDRDGYDRAGYNRDGYNRDGYDRDGYDRDGYDRAGYNRAGYNRAGYNRDGYDRDGYNRAGEKLEIVPLTLPEAK